MNIIGVIGLKGIALIAAGAMMLGFGWSIALEGGTIPHTVKGRFGERLEAAKLSLKHTIKGSPAMYKFASKLLYHIRK